MREKGRRTRGSAGGRIENGTWGRSERGDREKEKEERARGMRVKRGESGGWGLEERGDEGVRGCYGAWLVQVP